MSQCNAKSAVAILSMTVSGTSMTFKIVNLGTADCKGSSGESYTISFFGTQGSMLSIPEVNFLLLILEQSHELIAGGAEEKREQKREKTSEKMREKTKRDRRRRRREEERGRKKRDVHSLWVTHSGGPPTAAII